MVNSLTPPVPEAPAKRVSKVEVLKEKSNFLREPVATEILQDTNFFSEDATQILKFHGSYQQDDRDNRKARTSAGLERDFQFMIRTRNPGGFIPPELYLVMDELSETYGNHTLRVTTRQGFQIHGVVKANLKTVMAAIIRNMGSTLGACGDLNRNVMAPPAPFADKPEYVYAREYADKLADLLRPQTEAYYEIWLDGEKAVTVEESPEVTEARLRNGNGTVFHDSQEPIYGTHYMPRKFKCCVTVPGDNSVDVLTHDLSLVVIIDKENRLQGFNLFVGGGMGRTHNKEETFARLADPLGYVPKELIFDAVKAIVAVQRDYSDRFNRRQARLKYLIKDWGVDKFKAEVEHYLGYKLKKSKRLPKFEYRDYLGWHQQGDGNLFLGVSIENGRVKDDENLKLKTALREIVKRYRLPVRLTANHNAVLYDIAPSDQAEIQAILDEHGVLSVDKIDPLTRYSMACPALPTCGLAVTESERVLPDINQRIRALLNRVGLQDEFFAIRMTGCPNGCARPYMAELGFVGTANEQYQLWLGGSPNSMRLAESFIERLHVNDLETRLEPLFVQYKQQRKGKGKRRESFGDFCARVGFESLREFANTYSAQTAEVQTAEAQTAVAQTAPDIASLN
ncbi:sulfite reductase, ferredoxin dependent [Leptolyngbya sp. FACHB-261]|uniref:sulfite reductase, ferredoxin dependent n=1 Tax=Leptolyngbya sp. FACHB-261 TaxID=2692806 RepID=UPI001687CC22|nr:sulfite reductase, ferredoxin dependent [Leptolyngbya sp. FACHB-261]MBD2099343.1 sulfite reductase, ferredoxin dependent [Leptolyngbya sp. FACHB-261]